MNKGSALTAHLRAAASMMEEGLYSKAKEELLAAIALEPLGDILSELYFQLGVCHMRLKEFNAAEEYLSESERILKALGVAENLHITEALILLYETAKDEQKLESFCSDVLAMDRYNFDARIALTDLYSKQGRYVEAEQIIKEALAFGGNDLRVLKACVCIEAKLDKYRDAIEHSKKFYELGGGFDLMVATAVADVRLKIGPVDECLRLYEEVYDACGDYEKFGLSNSLLSVSLYDEIYDRDKYSEILRFRLEYTSKLLKNKAFDNDASFFKKLRIGYLSNDFRVHPVGYFVVPVLKRSRVSRSEFICYNYGKPENKDFVGEFIYANADVTVDLYGVDNDETERILLEDRPDIMMELKSVSEDGRLELYAKRLAPVQISWIGFPISSGVASIDYIIADRCVDPYPKAQEMYSEKLLYLKDTFLCHDLVIEQSGGELPSQTNGYITFGCFNNYIKITDRTLKLWSEILRSVENSKIIFKAHLYGDDYVVELLVERLLRFGFEPGSFIIEPPERIDQYFKSYDKIDIVLDTYPFNGATTTFDALLFGVPVVSLVGEAHHTRVGLDLLSQVGLGDLACRSDREYVEKAVALANDLERLAYLKKNLREITRKSKLADANAFRVEYEYALRKVWVDYCVKKRSEANISYDANGKSIDMLRDELLNGADYIIKCFREEELAGDMRLILLNEYTAVHNRFTEMASCLESDNYPVSLIKRLNTVICKLRDMSDDQIIKVLESNTVALERLL